MKNVLPYLKHHSPTILTAIGAIGVVATAVTAVRATPKAMKLCEDLRLERVNNYEKEPTKVEYAMEAWPCYIPSVFIGAATITCIFGANVLNKRQQAAITSAYILLERSYKSYKDKVIELYGKETDQKVRQEVAKDKYKEEDVSKSSSSETLLFYEEHYGKYFERTMLEVQDAEYRLNRKLAKEGEASLNDFFSFLGLNEQKIGDALGWSQEVICDFYNPAWIDFEHELVTMEDGMECYIINILVKPTAGYDAPF